MTAAAFIALFQLLTQIGVGVVNALPGLLADYNAVKDSFSTTDQATANTALAAAMGVAEADVAKAVADLTAAGAA